MQKTLQGIHIHYIKYLFTNTVESHYLPIKTAKRAIARFLRINRHGECLKQAHVIRMKQKIFRTRGLGLFKLCLT